MRLIKPFLIIITLATFVNLLSITDIHSYSLQELYKISLENDAEVKAERELLEAEKAFLKQTKSALMPNLYFDSYYTAATYEKNTFGYNFAKRRYESKLIDEEQESYTYSINLEQSIYDREIIKRIEYAKKRVEYQTLKLHKVERDLALKLADAYCNYLISKANLELAIAEKETYHLQWKKLEDSLKLGLSSKIDVLEAQVSYELALANEIARKNELQAALINLQKITGIEINDVKAISFDDIQRKRVNITLNEWIEMANKSNSDMLLAKTNVEVYEQNLNIAKSKYLPKVSVLGKISDTNSLDSTIGGQDMRVIFRLTTPIFSGGRISSTVEEAYKRLRSQKEIENDVKRKVELQIIDAYNKWETLKKQVDAYKNALISATLYLEATEEAYNLRLKALTDLLEARSKLFKIKRDLINFSYNEYLNYLKLRILAGEPLEF